MKGKIIEIKEDERNIYDAILIIGILKDMSPIKPLNYKRDWKEHQDEYGNFQLEDFRIFDENTKECEKHKSESKLFHLGIVNIKQN